MHRAIRGALGAAGIGMTAAAPLGAQTCLGLHAVRAHPAQWSVTSARRDDMRTVEIGAAWREGRWLGAASGGAVLRRGAAHRGGGSAGALAAVALGARRDLCPYLRLRRDDVHEGEAIGHRRDTDLAAGVALARVAPAGAQASLLPTARLELVRGARVRRVGAASWFTEVGGQLGLTVRLPQHLSVAGAVGAALGNRVPLDGPHGYATSSLGVIWSW